MRVVNGKRPSDAQRISGLAIRRARDGKGFYQSELAEAMTRLRDRDFATRPARKRTVDPTLISHWEHGRHAVPPHWRRYLAEALDVSRSYLFGDLEAEEDRARKEAA